MHLLKDLRRHVDDLSLDVLEFGVALICHDIKQLLLLLLPLFQVYEAICHFAALRFELPLEQVVDLPLEKILVQVLKSRVVLLTSLVYRGLHLYSFDFFLEPDDTALEELLQDLDSLNDYIFENPLPLLQRNLVFLCISTELPHPVDL